jgi:hypothetical protein
MKPMIDHFVGISWKRVHARIGSKIRIAVIETTLTIRIFLNHEYANIYPTSRTNHPATIRIAGFIRNEELPRPYLDPSISP